MPESLWETEYTIPYRHTSPFRDSVQTAANVPARYLVQGPIGEDERQGTAIGVRLQGLLT
jgi:hypothetical protein